MIALKARLVLSLVVMVLLGVAACDDPPPPPVSNPGAGVDAPAISPPKRFDWTDQ